MCSSPLYIEYKLSERLCRVAITNRERALEIASRKTNAERRVLFDGSVSCLPRFRRCSDGQTPFVLLSLEGGDIKRDDKDVLPRQKCLDALAALRHAKWFQVHSPFTERVRTPLPRYPIKLSYAFRNTADPLTTTTRCRVPHEAPVVVHRLRRTHTFCGL